MLQQGLSALTTNQRHHHHHNDHYNHDHELKSIPPAAIVVPLDFSCTSSFCCVCGLLLLDFAATKEAIVRLLTQGGFFSDPSPGDLQEVVVLGLASRATNAGVSAYHALFLRERLLWEREQEETLEEDHWRYFGRTGTVQVDPEEHQEESEEGTSDLDALDSGATDLGLPRSSSILSSSSSWSDCW